MFQVKIFSERFSELIFEFKTNPLKLSRELPLSKSTLYHYASGEFTPSLQGLIVIADYFKCSTDFLLGVEHEVYFGEFASCPGFSERFPFLLKHFGVTKAVLCREMKISATSLYSWQNGSRDPSLDSVVKLSEFFRCTCDFLLGRES